jgi:segregation and condensation protein A
VQAGETTRPQEPSARASGRSAIYSVELEVFEGPLDLLLHLVRRHELEILDIPIAFITEKYLEYLDFMRSLDLEVAGDYLVMAATLAWLKSRELLPSIQSPAEAADSDDDDGEDPREALIRRLVEYERFKNAAADLDALPVSGRDVFARGADIDVPPLDPGLAPVTLFRLAEAYYRVLTRAKINKSHDVQLEPVTVAQRMTQLTLLLDKQQTFDFESLFLGRTWSSEKELRTLLVVTLMSVLELVKLGVAGLQQVPDSDSIRIYRLTAAEDAAELLATYDEEASFGDAGKPPPPPVLTEAELDAAEESVLLAEALAGADDTDLGPDAGTGPAANSPDEPADDPSPAEAPAADAIAGEPADHDEAALADDASAASETIDAEPADADDASATPETIDAESVETDDDDDDALLADDASATPETIDAEPAETDDDDAMNAEPAEPDDDDAALAGDAGAGTDAIATPETIDAGPAETDDDDALLADDASATPENIDAELAETDDDAAALADDASATPEPTETDDDDAMNAEPAEPDDDDAALVGDAGAGTDAIDEETIATNDADDVDPAPDEHASDPTDESADDPTDGPGQEEEA